MALMGFLPLNSQFSLQIKCLNKNYRYISVSKVGKSEIDMNQRSILQTTVHGKALLSMKCFENTLLFLAFLLLL